MCGRMTILSYGEASDAIRAIGADEGDWPLPAVKDRREDAFPQSWVPVVVRSDDTLTLEVRTLIWGYPVEWQSTPVFNTRIESVLQGVGMWRESAEHRRCLVPVARFYERHGSEMARSAKTGRPVKRLYGFRLDDEPITWLAGIYEDDHFSVVTTKANEQVAGVHSRMPLVLRQSELLVWLGEGYAQLADRADVALEVQPDPLPEESSKGAGQPSLF